MPWCRFLPVRLRRWSVELCRSGSTTYAVYDSRYATFSFIYAYRSGLLLHLAPLKSLPLGYTFGYILELLAFNIACLGLFKIAWYPLNMVLRAICFTMLLGGLCCDTGFGLLGVRWIMLEKIPGALHVAWSQSPGLVG